MFKFDCLVFSVSVSCVRSRAQSSATFSLCIEVLLRLLLFCGASVVSCSVLVAPPTQFWVIENVVRTLDVRDSCKSQPFVMKERNFKRRALFHVTKVSRCSLRFARRNQFRGAPSSLVGPWPCYFIILIRSEAIDAFVRLCRTYSLSEGLRFFCSPVC